METSKPVHFILFILYPEKMFIITGQSEAAAVCDRNEMTFASACAAHLLHISLRIVYICMHNNFALTQSMLVSLLHTYVLAL